MSERGVFAVDRGVWDHPMFASKDAFSKREAWMWLISEAAWKAHRRRIAGVMVDLTRGQVCHSLRHLADCWGWSVKRVRGFLEALTDDHMIATASDTGITIITICKYNEYQRVSLPKGTQEDTQTDTPSTTPSHTARAHEGHNIEDKESKEYSEAKASAPSGAPVYTDSRHELWGEGVPILISLGVAEKQSRTMIGSWLKTTRDDAQAVLGAIQRARDNRAHNPIPWITNALKGPNDERPGSVFSHSASQQSGSTAVFAGVAAAAERRARERSAAGQQRPQPRNDDLAERPDPELFGTG